MACVANFPVLFVAEPLQNNCVYMHAVQIRIINISIINRYSIPPSCFTCTPVRGLDKEPTLAGMTTPCRLTVMEGFTEVLILEAVVSVALALGLAFDSP